MSKLKAFLQPPAIGQTKEVVVSRRFKDDEGNVVPFIVQNISQEENERLSKQSMKRSRGDKTETLDQVLYGKRMIVACTVEPNFKDSEVCDFYHTVDPLDVPGKMLSIGEYQVLSAAIMEINGLPEAKDRIEEAKNC